MIKELNRITKIQFFLAIMLLFIFIFKANRLPPQIPLFYSKPEGEEQIADTLMIFLLPLSSFFFTVINNLIFTRYFSEDKFILKVIYYVDLLIILFTTFIFLRILFLVS